MIHRTVGVYLNGDTVENGVPSADLAAHIKHNINWRPGRGFFVDGHCLNQGYLSNDEVKKIERDLQSLDPLTVASEKYN